MQASEVNMIMCRPITACYKGYVDLKLPKPLLFSTRSPWFKPTGVFGMKNENGFKFLFDVFDLRILEKKLKSLPNGGELEPPLPWGVSTLKSPSPRVQYLFIFLKK